MNSKQRRKSRRGRKIFQAGLHAQEKINAVESQSASMSMQIELQGIDLERARTALAELTTDRDQLLVFLNAATRDADQVCKQAAEDADKMRRQAAADAETIQRLQLEL